MERVGRPGRVIDPDTGPLAAFACDLVTLRQNAAGRPTLRQLEARSGYSKATLSQACSGRALPTLNVTLAYVGACGADMDAWETRWRELATVLRQTCPQLIPDDADADPTAPEQMPPRPAPTADASRPRRAVIVPVVVAAAITAALMLMRPSGGALQARPPLASPSAAPTTQAATPDDGSGDGGGGDDNAGGQPADPALNPSSDQPTTPDTTPPDTTDPALIAAASSEPAPQQQPAPAAVPPSCPQGRFCWWDRPGFPGTMTNGCAAANLNNNTPWWCSRGFPFDLKPVSSYINNTGYRVWLQQNDDHQHHGTELCISPGAFDSDLTGDPNTTDRWVWMSDNPAPC